MFLNNYHLAFKRKVLLKNINIEFYQGRINHILGKNGVGKSKFAQDLYSHQEKYYKKIGLISTVTNIPLDITLNDLKKLVNQCNVNNNIEELSQLLNLDNIDPKLTLKKLSDGQKQKIKLLIFFMFDYDVLILDEMTNALDKKTVTEIYQFITNYIQRHPDKCILNITHNLSDLSNMAGAYFLISDKQIHEFESKELIIKKYIEGD